MNAPADSIEIDFDNRPLSDVIREVEAHYLSYVMAISDGNKTHASKMAGLTLDTFRRKTKRYHQRTVYVVE